MSTLIKLGAETIARMGVAIKTDKPRYMPEYRGIYLDGVLPGETALEYNKRVSIKLETSVTPYNGSYSAYYLLLAVNPKLLEVAEVSAPTILPPGLEEYTPVLHIRALSKFDLKDFEYLASLHVLD